MKILTICFSGTGNTAKIAELYRAAFESEGAQVTELYLPEATEKIKELDLNEFDLLGFGYPIHAFNAPENLLKFVKSLPKPNENKKAFIFKSSGEPVRMSDVSSLKLIKLLSKLDITVTNEYQYVMPYNIIFRHSNAMAYKMWETAKKLVPVDCREILSGNARKVKRMFMGGFLAWVLRIEHCGAHLIGKHFKVTDKCVNCGLCIKRCPQNNIKLTDKGKFKFGKHCLICMRCVFNCPRDAIKPSILNGWRVNGAYSFKPPETEEPKSKHDDYCRKAYNRYFNAAQEKIENFENSTIEN